MIYQKLTWHSHHGCSCPENIHSCGMPITEGSVQADISQLTSPDMLLFRSNRWKNYTILGKAHILCILLNIGLSYCRKTQQPQDTIRHTFQNLKRGARILIVHLFLLRPLLSMEKPTYWEQGTVVGGRVVPAHTKPCPWSPVPHHLNMVAQASNLST